MHFIVLYITILCIVAIYCAIFMVLDCAAVCSIMYSVKIGMFAMMSVESAW